MLSTGEIRGLAWRKARRSVANGACVEVAPVTGGVAVRDSKDPSGPVLAWRSDEWRAFASDVRQGRYDAL